MPTESTKGYGTAVAISDTLAGTYIAIAQMRDVNPPKVTVDSDDTKHMASTGQFKESAPGWVDAENLQMDLLYTKAQHNTLRGYVGLTKFWKITDPAGSTEIFEGYIVGLGKAHPMEGRVTAVCEVKPSSLPSFTPAA